MKHHHRGDTAQHSLDGVSLPADDAAAAAAGHGHGEGLQPRLLGDRLVDQDLSHLHVLG